jgi:hypothetical protein
MNHAENGQKQRFWAQVFASFISWLGIALGGATLAGGWLVVSCAQAQEQIDQLERQKQADAAIQRLRMRVRVSHCLPQATTVLVDWRRGGEGLGGTVTRGQFAAEQERATPAVVDQDAKAGEKKGSEVPKSDGIEVGKWSAWMPLESICGRAKSWVFPSVTVSFLPQGKKTLHPPQEIAVDFEFADERQVFKRWTERAPRGATVGFAFPSGELDGRGAGNAEFVRQLAGIAAHVKARRELLEKRFPEPVAPPSHFAILGHLAGYGQGPGSGLGKAIGFGVRHCNPEIVADECRVLELLGVNGLVDEKSIQAVQLAGQADKFRRVYWGGPGSGSPMAAVSSRGASEPDGCPFDPRLKTTMAEQVDRAIAQHQASGAQEKWALWWDEIGVAAKSHLQECPRCRDEFREYLRRHHVRPMDVGARSWDEVAPFPLWATESTKSGVKQTLAAPPAPDAAADRLRYYYSYRFMTHVTANLFPESARRLAAEGIPLYAMQGPTPSWNGSSLDWHEFYDSHANTALVWETSNRDPRAWQWESYLADILRGVSTRHAVLPMGCLVKPHRGAPAQRMLAGVARGVRVVEWYTYGPDYAKGDSFSQSPQLLEEVAKSSRFLARGEPYLWKSEWEVRPEVALVFPRSSEIWGRVGPLGMTALENAKWIYLALRHDHIPVSILSEQQLAEGSQITFACSMWWGPTCDAMRWKKSRPGCATAGGYGRMRSECRVTKRIKRANCRGRCWGLSTVGWRCGAKLLSIEQRRSKHLDHRLHPFRPRSPGSCQLRGELGRQPR